MIAGAGLLLPRLCFAQADQPVARTDQNSMTAHAQLLEKAKKGGIDIYFEGDSITRRWGALDYPEFLTNWKQNFFGWNAGNFGWGADTIQNILWRLNNGELDGVNPKVIVLLAGTNNVGRTRTRMTTSDRLGRAATATSAAPVTHWLRRRRCHIPPRAAVRRWRRVGRLRCPAGHRVTRGTG